MKRFIPMISMGLVALIAGSAVGWALFGERLNLAKSGQALPQTHATLLPQGRPLQSFTLIDQNGAAFNPESLQGHWSFVFFGYSHCPDICPNTLGELNATAQAIEQLTPTNARFLFVTVDPQRDTPAQLQEYVSYFNENFLGITGTAEQIANLARQLGVVYMKVDQPAKQDYAMDHSSAVVLLDPLGQMRAVFSAPHQAQTIAQDFVKIVTYFKKTTS